MRKRAHDSGHEDMGKDPVTAQNEMHDSPSQFKFMGRLTSLDPINSANVDRSLF